MDRKSQSAYTQLKTLAPSVPYMNFYQFCQWIEHIFADYPPLGSSSSPQQDPVRLYPDNSMRFPTSELQQLLLPDGQHDGGYPIATATFLGLYGVESPLPSCYTDEIHQQNEGQEALKSFLDIFNHRILTQYYRIWRKYTYPATFQAGGKDSLSRSLLGLIGLGIAGSERHVATPISRFLALLGSMRLPSRNSEGIRAIINLLAPESQAEITPHNPYRVAIDKQARQLRPKHLRLQNHLLLGKSMLDVNSMICVIINSDNPQERQSWLPGQSLYNDFFALVRVYLGYRCQLKLQLRIQPEQLPVACLGKQRLQLGYNALLRYSKPVSSSSSTPILVKLGYYQGLVHQQGLLEKQHVHYQF